MIRCLRQRHRHTVIALGIFLPVAFAVGIAARRPVPEVNSLPKELRPVVQQYDRQEWQRTDLFTKSPVQVHLMGEHGSTGKFAIALSAPKDFVKPDLIVYWVAGSPTITGELPGDAMLLGGFASVALPLPSKALTTSGVLVLFSLADNEIVDVTKPIQFGETPK